MRTPPTSCSRRSIRRRGAYFCPPAARSCCPIRSALSQLPHTLVAAFRATLEEAIQADLLLHVVDAASTTRDAQIAAVNAVLAEIGAAHIPQILVYNKIDLTGGEPRVERDEYGKIARVWISAGQGLGLDLARAALEEHAAAANRHTAARPAAA